MKNLTFTNILLTEIGREIISYATFKKQKVNEKKNKTGFIKGRLICENIRIICDIMNYTERNSIPGLLIMIDFEKAFDSISLKFS